MVALYGATLAEGLRREKSEPRKSVAGYVRRRMASRLVGRRPEGDAVELEVSAATSAVDTEDEVLEGESEGLGMLLLRLSGVGILPPTGEDAERFLRFSKVVERTRCVWQTYQRVILQRLKLANTLKMQRIF